MSEQTNASTGEAEAGDWKSIVARFSKPDLRRAVWQIANSHGSYLAVWALIYWAKDISWWLTVPLAVLAGGLLVRIFIIFHDCGHGSFFASRKANDVLGSISGVLTFTPYHHWRGEHAIHHRTSADLDRRGVGDVWTMTVEEYLNSSRGRRFAYRLARNPVILFLLAPLFVFLVLERFPSSWADKRERLSVWWTNAALVALAVAMGFTFGWGHYLVLQGIAMGVAASSGVWLFYVQHQFEGVYWERGKDWDYARAALDGSSFYALPKWLQWFSGNIGFHHVHHLSPRVPNYYLEACHKSDPLFTRVKPLTLLASRKSLGLRLWDESTRQLVGYRHLRALRSGPHKSPTQRSAEQSEPRRVAESSR